MKDLFCRNALSSACHRRIRGGLAPVQRAHYDIIGENFFEKIQKSPKIAKIERLPVQIVQPGLKLAMLY
jgi:hypothetical protein